MPKSCASFRASSACAFSLRIAPAKMPRAGYCERRTPTWRRSTSSMRRPTEAGRATTARRILRKADANLAAVDFFHAPTDRSWTRDYCPPYTAKGGRQPGGGRLLPCADRPKLDARLLPAVYCERRTPTWRRSTSSMRRPTEAGRATTARRILRKADANLAAVDFFHAPTDRSWTRDYCPPYTAKGGRQPGGGRLLPC